jgi:ATP-dependent exoDNAse (exonuclease V) beta subunit
VAHPGIAAIEKEHRIRLLSGDAKTSITGHIDFLQVRNGAVHILDYKPDARTNKPIAQLTVYALALARLTGRPVAKQPEMVG